MKQSVNHRGTEKVIWTRMSWRRELSGWGLRCIGTFAQGFLSRLRGFYCAFSVTLWCINLMEDS